MVKRGKMSANSAPSDLSSLCAFGPLRIYRREKRVEVSGKAIDLTAKEYALLTYLAANPGQAHTRIKLLAEIWGFDFFGETRTVDAHIWSLRRKLGDTAKMIETVHGVGYRFKAGDFRF